MDAGIPDGFTTLLNQLAFFDHQFSVFFDTAFLIFARLLGFTLNGPVFSRKDIPFPIKISFATALTLILVWTQPMDAAHHQLISSENIGWYMLLIAVNITVGYVIGFIGGTILEVISSAGSLMNNQIGLSSAMVFDPGTRQQVALIEKLFSYIGLLLFFELGGMYWMISAIQRTFDVFPIYSATPDFVGQINFEYYATITGNCIDIGVQLIAPVIVVTMAIDMILGIVNRTAQQIQVFQLSFALKPSIGVATLLAVMPIFIKVTEHYLQDYSSIF